MNESDLLVALSSAETSPVTLPQHPQIADWKRKGAGISPRRENMATPLFRLAAQPAVTGESHQAQTGEQGVSARFRNEREILALVRDGPGAER